MKFGSFSHVFTKPGMTPNERYSQLWREVRLCDELGFDYFFAVEHHFIRGESLMSSPPAFIAGAGVQTKNIRIGAMGYLTPFYKPIRIIEDVGVLDQMLNGRLEIGLVHGIGSPVWFSHYGAKYEDRREYGKEVISAIKAAFTSEGDFNFEGKHSEYKDVFIMVKPVQQPHPPIWFPTGDLETLNFIAGHGVHTSYVMYDPRSEMKEIYKQYVNNWKDAGQVGKPDIGYWTFVCVAKTDEEAWEKAWPGIVHEYTKVRNYTDPNLKFNLPQLYEQQGKHGSAEIVRNLLNREFVDKRKLYFIGSPDTVADLLAEAADEGHFNTLYGEFNYPYLSDEDLMTSYRLFAENVIPRLRDYEPY